MFFRRKTLRARYRLLDEPVWQSISIDCRFVICRKPNMQYALNGGRTTALQKNVDVFVTLPRDELPASLSQ
jgi:hypothetical protein